MVLKVVPNKFLFATIGFALIGTNAHAASFAIKEQNVTNLGFAYAGTASLAEDASTGYYNPAGLTELKHDQLQFSTVYLNGRFTLKPDSATKQNGDPVTPLAEDTPNGDAFVPALHLSKRITDNLVFGFNVASPFGLKNEYGDNSVARYMATRSELLTVNLSPALGYKVNDKWSVGVGVDALYGKAWLDAKLNLGFGEGEQKNEASAWDYSFHAGVLYKVSDSTRIGLNYRHRYILDADGTSTTTNGGTITPHRTVHAVVNLPESITYSVYHKYDDKWNITADVEWMHWSRFKELKLTFSSGDPTIVPENYKNTFRISGGTSYKYNDQFLLRMGIAYDQSPTQEEFRTARIPDTDRFWIAIGGKYIFNDSLEIDFGYSHIFFKNGAKNASIDEFGPGASTLSGEYDPKADLVGVQLIWNFV